MLNETIKKTVVQHMHAGDMFDEIWKSLKGFMTYLGCWIAVCILTCFRNTRHELLIQTAVSHFGSKECFCEKFLLTISESLEVFLFELILYLTRNVSVCSFFEKGNVVLKYLLDLFSMYCYCMYSLCYGSFIEIFCPLATSVFLFH